MQDLDLVRSSLENPRFPHSLPFVVMILMTMGIHRDVLFHMLSHVEFSHEQRNALKLASLQLKAFYMLARFKREVCVGRFKYLFSNFKNRACFNMLDDNGDLRFYADQGKFICNGMYMPSFELLRRNIISDPQQFWRILQMNKKELELHKIRILINEGLVLLGTSSIFPLFKNPDFIERIFRIWKKKAFVGDKYGKPIDFEPEFSRREEDVMFLFLCFLAADTKFMKEFMVTKNFLETHLISDEVTTKMRTILYTNCKGAQGLEDSAKLVHKPLTVFDYMIFFASRDYKHMWEPSFWFLLMNNASRPSLVSRKSLEYQNRFERFHEVFRMFMKDQD